ncbi:MAG: exopolysaccharide production protein [Salinibacterium sp.]|nr:MAG: exopolysaccharide production protein [Salinibacterium sp.]
MTKPAASLDATLEFAANPSVAAALSLCIVGTAFGSHLIESLIGSAGLIGIVATLVVLSVLVLVARWGTFEWQWLLPISLLVFLAWCALSTFWSSYQWQSVGSVCAQFALAYLGIFVAVARDVIQIVRAFGDVLRAVIGLSLAIEVLAGLLIDSPIRFLGVAGDLAEGGPIQGIMGTRNQLSLIAILAIITFIIELTTHSVRRGVSGASIAAASLTLLLTQSSIGIGVLLVVSLAGLALLGLRALNPEQRVRAQIGLASLAIIALAGAWAFRSVIVNWLNASDDLAYRLGVWRQLLNLGSVHTLEGWGWTGKWPTDLLPYSAIETANGAQYSSAYNSYLDAWFQLGLIGLAILLILVALAFVRSWLLASGQHSRVFVWPALVLVALLVTSLAESSLIVSYGWLTLVICVVKSAEKLSWRRQLPD